MSKFNIPLVFLCFVLTVSPARGQVVSEISFLPGERWSGLYAGNYPEDAFSEPFEIYTAEMNGSCFYTPFLVSSAGRYIRGYQPMNLDFDGRRFLITTESEKIEPQKGGRTLRQTYLAMHHRNFQENDRFPAPELFTNLVYETACDFGFSHTSEDILGYARELISQGYPPGIMVIADGWRSPLEWDFDPRYYPDPARFIDDMHKLGFLVMLTVTPYVPAWGRDFAELSRNGGLVAPQEGTPLVMTGPEGTFAAVDYTATSRSEALRESLSSLQSRYGVDGYRFDCSRLVEQIHVRPEFARKYLTAFKEAGADFALCEYWPGVPEHQSERVSALLSMQPDEAAYLRDVVTVGIAAGPFTQIFPAYGGSVYRSEDKTGIRYTLMQAMMPVAHVPFAPWADADHAAELERVLEFRQSIAKYMGATFDEVCKTLEPIVRPMEYMYHKEGFSDCTDQYLIGHKYLIAPAISSNPKRLVRLPKGIWRGMDGKKHKGPLVLEVETEGYRMCWFELTK